MSLPRVSSAALAGLLSACGGSHELPPPTQTGSGGGLGGCAPGELLVGDRCEAAGIPPDGCAAGFEPHEEEGCVPVLPAEPCPKGSMAVPGETTCREVAPCGSGTWGRIPVDGDTVYVDADYAGLDSDGSSAKPWITIQAAVDAAPSGALVAIAAGTYIEDVVVASKPVRLWGRCPSLVSVVGSDALAAILLDDAPGTEVRDLAVTGATSGIAVWSDGAVLDRLWIHDLSGRGVNVQDDVGIIAVTISRSLIELTHTFGAYSSGSMLRIESSVIRDTLLASGLATGVQAEVGLVFGDHGRVDVVGSVIERNHTSGVLFSGGDGLVEATVVRTNQPAPGTRGAALGAQPDSAGLRPTVQFRSSVLQANEDGGIYLAGCDAVVDTTVVRDGRQSIDGFGGRGMGIEDEPATDQHTIVEVTRSLFLRNSQAGIFVASGDALVELTIVRDTEADAAQEFGRGIAIQRHPLGDRRATVIVRGSRIERNHEVGLFMSGQELAMDQTLVAGTLPLADGAAGRGVEIVHDPLFGDRGSATLAGSSIEDSYEFGLVILGADAVVSDITVSRTRPRVSDGLFGDGIAVGAEPFDATLIATDARVAENGRAGVASFGAHVTLESCRLECNPLDLVGEAYNMTPFTLIDNGGNRCGCAEPVDCKAQSAGLEPPTASRFE